jgi:peptide chain release factor 1
MFETFPAILDRYAEIERQLADPVTAGQGARMAALVREHGRLTKLVAPYREYQSVLSKRAEAEAILQDPAGDPDLAALAREEAADLAQRERQLVDRLADLVARDPEDDLSSCILEIRAGTGGEEAALFARDLFSLYQKYAERHGWTVEVLDKSVTDLGGFKEVIFAASGPEVYRHLRYEGGGHRVQRVPVTEASGRKHTSAVTVAVMPEVEDVEVDLKKEDLDIERIRASGPGGQNVNKVSSAIRLTHRPTGLVVSCQDEQSQHKNLAKAMRVLKSRLYELQQEKQKAELDSARRSQIGSGDRSDRIRTYNFHENRVTDHRLNLTIYNLDHVMDGHLDEIVDVLIERARQERLAAV